MNDNFDITRFASVLIDDLRINKRNYLMAISAILGTIALICIWWPAQFIDYSYHIYNSYHIYSGSTSDPAWHLMTILYWIGASVLALLAALAMGRPLRTKQDRIAMLTIPATQSEKYWSRWLILIPVALIIFTIGFELIDLLRVSILMLIKPEYKMLIHPVGSYIFTFGNNKLDGYWFAISYLITMQSLYVLGSSIWPGRSFLPTTLWLVCYNIAMSIIIGILSTNFAFYLTTHDLTVNPPEWLRNIDDVKSWWFFIPALLFSIFNYVLAYYRLKEIEIVQRW